MLRLKHFVIFVVIKIKTIGISNYSKRDDIYDISLNEANFPHVHVMERLYNPLTWISKAELCIYYFILWTTSVPQLELPVYRDFIPLDHTKSYSKFIVSLCYVRKARSSVVVFNCKHFRWKKMTVFLPMFSNILVAHR